MKRLAGGSGERAGPENWVQCPGTRVPGSQVPGSQRDLRVCGFLGMWRSQISVFSGSQGQRSFPGA